MAENEVSPDLRPKKSEPMPKSYALRVTDRGLHVWQYRVDISEPDGEWQFVETLGSDRNPRLSLEYATLETPSDDGYWIYAKSYDCAWDC